MKELLSLPLGSQAKASLSVDGGDLLLGAAGKLGDLSIDAKIGYPVAKILEPIKAAIVDKLKAAIPNQVVDGLIEKAWDEAVALVSEAPAAVPAA